MENETKGGEETKRDLVLVARLRERTIKGNKRERTRRIQNVNREIEIRNFDTERRVAIIRSIQVGKEKGRKRAGKEIQSRS